MMRKNRDANTIQVVDGEVIPAGYTHRLATIKDCRRELAKVYTDARQLKISPPDATRLTYILIALSNMIRDSELEERVRKLEDQATKGKS